jgi:hypothetical protein
MWVKIRKKSGAGANKLLKYCGKTVSGAASAAAILAVHNSLRNATINGWKMVYFYRTNP